MNEQAPLPEDLMAQVEDFAVTFLSEGRADWDVPHTRSVVYYAGLLAQAVAEADPLVLTTAAWFHDIGYFGLFDDGDSARYGHVQDKKMLHMIKGADMAREFLERDEVVRRYTADQRERIIHLVGVHDKLDQLRELDEIILMEADTLGAIDIARVKPTFDGAGAEKYIAKLKAKRLPLFRTDLGKDLAEELVPIFEAYFA